jgi:transcriptional regulator with XRE-family HTH domain
MTSTKRERRAAGPAPRQADQAAGLATGSLAPPRPSARALEAAIGAEVRALRHGLDLTGADLAQSAGLSVGMLSKIENGQISPSLATLQALARALNVPIARLLADAEESRDCTFVKAGAGLRIDRRGTKAGHIYDLLGHSVDGPIAVEPYLITLTADAAPYADFRHQGVEFIYMLTGKVTYRHGERTYDLAPGDALLFDSAARHGPEVLHRQPATFLSVIVYPRQAKRRSPADRPAPAFKTGPAGRAGSI